jgi:hypothetical protein
MSAVISPRYMRQVDDLLTTWVNILRCTACHSMFTDAVSLETCHCVFCHKCITRHMEIHDRDTNCPKCTVVFRPHDIIENHVYRNLTALYRPLLDQIGPKRKELVLNPISPNKPSKQFRVNHSEESKLPPVLIESSPELKKRLPSTQHKTVTFRTSSQSQSTISSSSSEIVSEVIQSKSVAKNQFGGKNSSTSNVALSESSSTSSVSSTSEEESNEIERIVQPQTMLSAIATRPSVEFQALSQLPTATSAVVASSNLLPLVSQIVTSSEPRLEESQSLNHSAKQINPHLSAHEVSQAVLERPPALKLPFVIAYSQLDQSQVVCQTWREYTFL